MRRPQVIGWTVGAMLVGAGLYPLLQAARERDWCTFVGTTPHEYKVRQHLSHDVSVACPWYVRAMPLTQ